MQKKRDEQEKRVGFVITEHPSFRAAYVSGVFGGLDPNDGRIVFFLDRIKPGMRKEPRGAMQLEKINRELQVEIHMSPPQFASVARWMIGHVQRFEKRVKEGGFKKDVADSPQSSYIG